jgi:PIN domain nuclease of toxin-antitoxin system
VTRVLLDTCAWIWLASDRQRLSAAAMEVVAGARKDGGVGVSVISCWEVAKLVEKGRLAFRIPVRDWIHRALRLDGLALLDLIPDVCVGSTELPGTFHGDPADQILVATARHLGAVLVTPDRAIREYPHVPTIW